MPSPPRVALYARVSTLDRGQSLGLQLDELRQVAAQRGWVVVDTYEDAGVSGAARSRPGLDRLLADAQAGRFDLLAIWKLDRLGRDLAHTVLTLDQLTALGIAFVSLRDPGLDTTSAGGRLLLQIMAAFAEHERAVIQERVVAGVRRAQAAGKHCGRPRTFIDPRPAVALLREGRSLRETARLLQCSHTTLRRALTDAGQWPLPHDGTP